MIFVTVGTQLPFDRMIRTIDEWAAATNRTDVFAQIGPSALCPRHIEWVRFLDAVEFRRKVEQASVIIAHAGMGSIISALELGKPIMVMPRSAALGEQRNDHQLATARQLLARGQVVVAFDEAHLMEKLKGVDRLRGSERIATEASPRLLRMLREFITSGTLETADVVDGSDRLVDAQQSARAAHASAVLEYHTASDARGM